MKKNKAIKLTARVEYERYLLNILFSMFKYTGLPFRKEFLEWHLQRWGWVAIAKKDNDIYVGTIAGFTPDVAYGLPANGTKTTFITRHGLEFEVTIGVDCVIGYNNVTRMPSLFVGSTADMFTEIETSERVALIKSRVSNIPVADDNNKKAAIDEILKQIEDGSMRSIAYKSLLSDLANGETTLKTISLTNPEDTQLLQYISKYKDDRLRWFMTMYGHSLSSASKLAQVNSDEIEGYKTYSMILPDDMLESRKELIELCNSVLGTQFSVDFSRPWEHLKKVDTEISEENESEVDDDEIGIH